jgi:hypothetical protein
VKEPPLRSHKRASPSRERIRHNPHPVVSVETGLAVAPTAAWRGRGGQWRGTIEEGGGGGTCFPKPTPSHDATPAREEILSYDVLQHTRFPGALATHDSDLWKVERGKAKDGKRILEFVHDGNQPILVHFSRVLWSLKARGEGGGHY